MNDHVALLGLLLALATAHSAPVSTPEIELLTEQAGTKLR
jgi:hypothetical protein